MTAAEAIASLDRQIEEHGQTVMLRRTVANAAPIERTVQAFVRGYKADELVAGMNQGDSLVVISPTSLVGSPFASIPIRPLDKITVGGRERTIGPVEAVSIGDVVVRFNVPARG